MFDKEEYIAYLKGRKSSPKVNYHLECLKEIKKLEKEGRKPSLLLHACCAVCACWPLEFLKDHFDLAVMYNNSNIWPEAEHEKRLSELKRYIDEALGGSVPVIVTDYRSADYMKQLEPMKDDPEGWKRCFFCYETRMDEAFRYADEHEFDYFTTVMTFSRQKDSQKINQIGLDLQKKYTRTKYLCSDFKKGGGQTRSAEIVDEHCIYRQDYCGCIYSLRERHEK